MSQENVEIIRRALAAPDRRDVEAYWGYAASFASAGRRRLRLAHGKIRRAHIFSDRTEALEAVGLAE